MFVDSKPLFRSWRSCLEKCCCCCCSDVQCSMALKSLHAVTLLFSVYSLCVIVCCCTHTTQPLSLATCMHSRSVHTQPHAQGGATPSAIGSGGNTHHSSTQAATTGVHVQRLTAKKKVDGPAGVPDQQARLLRQPSGLVVQRVLLAAGRRAQSCCVIQSTATAFSCLFPRESVLLLSTTLPRHHMGGRAAWHSCVCLVREYEICRQHLCGMRTPCTATHTHKQKKEALRIIIPRHKSTRTHYSTTGA